MLSSFRFKVLVIGAALLATAAARADVRLARVFSENMVLQREKKIAVWGWADAGEKVTVAIAGKQASAVADAKGAWSVNLGPFTAGGPHEMTISGKNTITFKNVFFGEVWICSGQSNMQWGVGGAANPQQEIAAANYPQIRLLTVRNVTALTPQPDAPTDGWVECKPETIGGFTAVGYFFGRHVHQTLNVPVGLINSSWGGTICEAWTSAETLKKLEDFAPRVEQVEEMAAAAEKGTFDLDKAMTEWWAKNDPGSANGLGWADPAFDASGWKTMNLPAGWESAGLPDYDGIVWFRNEFDLPAAWAGKDLMLHLGPIDDRDTTFVNGVKVGSRDVWTEPRDYKVPASALKSGRNVIAVRVLDTGGGGGMYGQVDQMKVEIAGDNQTAPMPLAGAWQYRESGALAKLSPAPQPLNNNPNVSTVLYNAMIAPLVPYGIRGAIWYQGESNAGRGYQYRTLFPAMIQDWRKQWNDNLAFGFVQLANFMGVKNEPGESAWAELREAQNMTLSLPNTGQAVIIDIGEANDIHPKNKQDVGKRLALWAEATVYGKKIVYSGPRYKAMKVEGNKIRLTFDHIGTGLVAKGGAPLKQFAIAGADKKFVWANAKIDGQTVVVSSDQVPQPVAVRYAWADNPEGCNLYNNEDLPATPFRTDDWPGVTVDAK